MPDDRRGDRRDRAEHRGGGGGFHGRYYGYYPGWYGWYGGFWSGLFWSWDYGYPWYEPYPYGYGYPGGYGHGYGHYGRHAIDTGYGALDLDVSPAKTEVYLDGEYIGRVDAFDGFPQYLWLEDGTYDLVFYKDGYQTVSRQVTVRPGIVQQVDFAMARGESVRPENLATKTHERRDQRLRYERDAHRRAGEAEDDDENEAEESAEAQGKTHGESAEAAEGSAAVEEQHNDGREEHATPGRVRLDVDPEDASVYLDGRFLGTGAELARLHSGLLVDRGEHRLAVVRPGYHQRELSFEVKPGEDLELEVDLEPGT